MPDITIDARLLEDLAPDGMRAIEAGGKKLLLARDGGSIRALSGTCPHAGGPLAEGVRHGTRIVCPWHKATFCLRTGAVLEPPALDPLDRFDVTQDARGVTLSKIEPAQPERPADARCFVIVGAGAAGAVAAQTLREEGFGGRIVMLDRENRLPYDRTVLSKYALSGEKGAEKTPLQSQAYYAAQGIERITADVTGIDAEQRRITCACGTIYSYDSALLATGGALRKPELPGAGRPRVFLLRSRADAEAILAQAERSHRVVVLGASFIGMEVAASLRERGLAVTVAGQEAEPFEKQLGPQIGRALRTLHESKGVTFKLGRKIAAIAGTSAVEHVVLEGGEEIAADFVVIGFGVRPATDFAAGLPRDDDGALTVDALLAIAPGLYAAGDIARFPGHSPGTAGEFTPMRVEHWRVAQQHGRIAALNMLGRAVPYRAVPVFWTIQYLKRVDYIGHAKDWDETIIYGDLGKPEFLAYFVKNGSVAAAAGMDRDRDTAALCELLGLDRAWTPAELGEHPADLLATLHQ